MTTIFDLNAFKLIPPEHDRNLVDYFVAPTILPALQNAESTIVAAGAGYGKSIVGFVAQQQMRGRWLNVKLHLPERTNDEFMTALLREISLGIWNYIESNPGALANLQTRAEAVRYFLQKFSDVDVDYLLDCLIDDYPEHTEIIRHFLAIQPRALFTEAATDTQRLSILCDSVKKLGLEDVAIWIDIAQELEDLPNDHLYLLQDFFDSLYLMRRRTFHIKCLASPSVCRHLRELRGVQTLSVTTLELTWEHEQLEQMIEQRLRVASHNQIGALAQLLNSETFEAFLAEFSDPGSPLERLTLVRLIAETVNRRAAFPITEPDWLAIRRAYCAERVKIRLDQQGNFWRGKHLLEDLTPQKRAIYPLVRYLYEHPGFHRTYNLTGALKVDENNLNTIVSRARKEHLEPFPITSSDNEEAWIYLVTDLKRGGYALQHTDRSL